MAQINFPAASESPWYNPNNGVTYEYINGTWRTVTTATELDDLYVNVSGDNMDGDLTLGPDGGPPEVQVRRSNGGIPAIVEVGQANAYIDADGRIVAHADVTEIGPELFITDASAGTTYIHANSYGLSIGGRISAADPEGSGTINLKANGSATFSSGNLSIAPSGRLDIPSTLSGTAAAIRLYESGDNTPSLAIRANGTVRVGKSDAGANGRVLINSSGSIEHSEGSYSINDDGSADFAGTVEALRCDVHGTQSTDTAFFANVGSGAQGFRVACSGKTDIGWNVGDSKPNTTLNADGSANFAGELIIFGDPRGGANTGIRFGANGPVQCARPTNSNPVYQGYKTKTATPTSQIFANGDASFVGDIDAKNVNFKLEPDNDANYTVTTEEYEEQEELTPYIPAVDPVVGPLGNVLIEGTPAIEATYQTVTKTREIRTYTGPTLDVKERLQNLIARLDSLEADEVTDDATSTLLLTTVNNLNADMAKTKAALTAIRTAANAAGTLEQLKADIATATADI